MFNNERYYDIEIDGHTERVPSVTTILGVIAKPALIKWAENQGVKKALQVLELLDEDTKKKVIEKLPEGFIQSTREKSQEALDIGSRVHHLIDSWHDKAPIDYSQDPEAVKRCMDGFHAWAKEVGLTPEGVISKEKTVYSKINKYAGTLDLVAVVNGKKTLLDFKTSSGIYDEYVLQVEAYHQAWLEMGMNGVEQLAVVRFDKKPDSKVPFEAKIFQPDFNRVQTFLHALHLFNGLKVVSDGLRKRNDGSSQQNGRVRGKVGNGKRAVVVSQGNEEIIIG